MYRGSALSAFFSLTDSCHDENQGNSDGIAATFFGKDWKTWELAVSPVVDMLLFLE